VSDGGTTVLVVDDNRPIADTYAAFVGDEHEVLTAYGGEEALEKIDPSVDVVLLDRRMPDLSGDEVLAEIERRALDPRVVMVTAVDPEFDIVDMPFDDYVVKPVKRADIADIVAEMLQRASYDDDLRQFLALASKQATLERERDSAALARSEEYERIQQRLAEMRDRLGVDTDDLEAVVRGDAPDIAATARSSTN